MTGRLTRSARRLALHSRPVGPLAGQLSDALATLWAIRMPTGRHPETRSASLRRRQRSGSAVRATPGRRDRARRPELLSRTASRSPRRPVQPSTDPVNSSFGGSGLDHLAQVGTSTRRDLVTGTVVAGVVGGDW